MNKKIVVAILLLCAVLSMGCLEEEEQIYVQEVVEESVVLEPEKNIETNSDKCERIAKEYYETHIYVDNDVYDCDNMACDIWNILKAEGINSKISIGNVDYDIDSIKDANHAWILAEVEPGLYLAIECTGGYIVYYEDNPLYYESWTFNNPKNLRKYISLCDDYNNQIERYNTAVDRYDYLYSKYNGKQLTDNEYNIAVTKLNNAVENINNEIEILNDISKEIEYILTYG